MSEIPVSRAAFLTHFDYTLWASMRILDAAGRLTPAELTQDLQVSHRSLLGTLQHVYYADRIWLSRLEMRTLASFEDPAPGPDLDALKQHWPVVIRGLRDFVEHAPEGLFSELLHFRRLNGDQQKMEHWKVLLHIVNHATLHRGQAMTMLRQLGHIPPGTDYLFYHLQL
ncbi:MAG TPA: DinB family protein [Bryobacteraceae bacterium]|nr:DinB family protein [Bryobacteraceae bacterium]